MSTPTITLMSGIQTPLDPSTVFMLDSTDLGVLDTDILDGTVDTEFVAPVQGITISRGRSRQLDRFNAGSATIDFYNADRKLDPLNEASDYYGLIQPRLRFKILADNIPIFTGYATDWDLEYDITGKDLANVACTDYFGLLANISFPEETPPELATGPAIDYALKYFAYPYPTNIDIGNANLGAYLIEEGTQLLEYLFQIARSDAGKLFIDGAGVLQYFDRFGRGETAEVAFADDGTGIGYSNLMNEYGDELLYNQVIVSSPAGTAEASRQDSIDQYGLSTLSYTDVLNNSIIGLQDLADRFLEQYQSPKVRFTGLSVELAGLSTADRADVLGLDLGDLVTVKRTFATGSPGSVTQQLFVSGVRHRIGVDSHVVEFAFEPNPFLKYLRLDANPRGKINDENTLG
jgi:hypothetical protein